MYSFSINKTDIFLKMSSDGTTTTGDDWMRNLRAVNCHAKGYIAIGNVERYLPNFFTADFITQDSDCWTQMAAGFYLH